MLTPERIEEIINNAINLLRSSAYFSIGSFGDLLKLLLLKKLLDQYEVEVAQREKKDYFLNSRKSSVWLELKKVNQNTAEEISRIFTAIEEANPKYKNIFTSSDENEWERIGNTELRTLIGILANLNFFSAEESKSSLIADIFEQLFDRFIRIYRAPVGDTATPRKVAELLVNLVDPSENIKICDPACRSGEILTECIRYLEKHKKNPSKVEFFGQEKNSTLLSIAKMNLLLRETSSFEVSPRDVIVDPLLTRDRELMLFDLVITNPPFGVRNWRSQKWDDAYGRFKYGNPPNSSADFAFIQHVLATLEETGKAAIIVPRGVLFRGGLEGKIRKNIVEDNLIEAVIELPSGLFYDSPISTAVIIFNKRRDERHQEQILFINTDCETELDWKKTFLGDDDISKIVFTYSNFLEEPGYSRLVAHQEIADHGFDLQSSQYTTLRNSKTDWDISDKVKKIRELEHHRSKLESQMNECLRALGIEI